MVGEQPWTIAWFRRIESLLTQEAVNPVSEFFEGWQNLTIDLSVWSVVNPATGTAWTPQINPLMSAYLVNSSVPNANENCRLCTQQVWPLCTLATPTRMILKRLIVEWEMYLEAVVNMDNTLCFFGLTQTIVSTRATNNLQGFGLNTDVLETVTDVAGVEETNTGFGETINQFNKYKMELHHANNIPTVDFYLNEVLIAQHITTVGSIPSYLNFFVDTEVGGQGTIAVGPVRSWYEDVER